MADIIKVEIRGLTGGPVRASLRAAANVLMDQAKANVARAIPANR